MFSVIMPTYNCVKYVTSSVQSVLAQTHTDFELLIIDDGSVDGTYELLQDISSQDSRVKLYQISHGGVSAARNYGIENAQGDQILFIDGDDTWKPHLLETCLQKGSFELLLFGIQSDWYGDDGSLSYSKQSMDGSSNIGQIVIQGSIDTLFSKYNMASPCNKVYKRSIINDYNVRFSTKCVYLEDLKFNIDYLKHITAIHIINEDLYEYRLNIGQNQIFKRRFCGVFLNADELFISTDEFLRALSSSLSKETILVSVLINAYYKEFCSHIFGKDKAYSRSVLKQLNSNQYYRKLLKCTSGKFFTVLKTLLKFKCYSIQIQIIKRRYNK